MSEDATANVDAAESTAPAAYETKQPAPEQPAAAAPEQPEDRDLSHQPSWVQKIVADARKEAGDARVAAKESAAKEAREGLAQDIGRLLGLVEGDEKVDPDALTRQISAEQERTRAAQRELAVYRGAAAAGGDPDALLDSNSFLRSIESVDPTDQAKIAAAIAEAVKNNGKLAAVQQGRVPSRSGADSGGSGEQAISQKSFDQMSGQERNALFNSNPQLYRRLSGRG